MFNIGQENGRMKKHIMVTFEMRNEQLYEK